MLGGDFSKCVWNLAMFSSRALQRRFLPELPLEYPVFVEREGTTHRIYVGGGSDETIFREIFIDEHYATALPQAPKVILDLGGNVGYAAIYFAMRFPQARIYTIEPDPRAFATLLRNTATFPNITACHLAISDVDGEVLLRCNPRRTMSSSLLARPGATTTVSVRASTLDRFVDQEAIRNIDLLKFDIEGAEYAAFRNTRVISQIDYLVGEVHEDLMPASWDEFKALFQGFDIEDTSVGAGRRLMRARRHSCQRQLV